MCYNKILKKGVNSMTTKIKFSNGNFAEISGSKKESMHQEDILGRWRISDYGECAFVINEGHESAMLKQEQPTVTGEEVGLPFIQEISFCEREARK